MDFNKLDDNLKQKLHEEILAYANSIGGINHFLKTIEEIRSETPNPLLNKTGTFHTSTSKITLTKSIYKETFSLLFNAMRREEKGGDMLDGINPKEYKTTMNMMRTLRPITIDVVSKKDETLEGFNISILDVTQEKKTKVTWIFKIMFFYHLDEAKKALNYKVK